MYCFVCLVKGLGYAAEFLDSEQLTLGIVSCVILSVLCLVFLKIFACGFSAFVDETQVLSISVKLQALNQERGNKVVKN